MVLGGTTNSSKEGPWGVEKMWSRGGWGQKMYSQENSKNKWSNSTKKLVRGGSSQVPHLTCF